MVLLYGPIKSLLNSIHTEESGAWSERGVHPSVPLTCDIPRHVMSDGNTQHAMDPNHGGTTGPRFQFVLTDSRDPICPGHRALQGDRQRGGMGKRTRDARMRHCLVLMFVIGGNYTSIRISLHEYVLCRASRQLAV